MTVDSLVERLFLEEWSTSLNYSHYVQQCAVSSCSYTYIEQADVLETASTIIGLFGGLTAGLKWGCPLLIKIGRFLRTLVPALNVVEPENSEE